MTLPFAGRLLPHHLLTYGSDPASWSGGYDGTRLTYSDMNGFGPFLPPFAWFKLYSAGWAVLLGVAASVLWVRGREPGARARLRQARARFTAPLRRTTAVAVMVIAGAAGFILYNTNVLNALDAAGQETRAAAAYEQQYSRFRDAPQPTIERARLRVEIHPDDPAVELSGSLRLVNRTTGPIDSLHVTTNRDLDARAITLDRKAKAEVGDSALGYYVYALAHPLLPGDSIELSFESEVRPRGFPNGNPRTDVVENGTHFGRDWIPFVGYGPVGTRTAEPRVLLETIVGTTADQVAVAPGVMRREWTENGRRYFQYETESPQSFDVAVVSARYSVRSDRWNDPSAGSGRGVTLGVYHHPDHDRNVDTLVRDAKAALAYQSAQFGPYESAVLRIVEIPRYQRVARAHPTMVVFSEHAFFARTDASPIDGLFFATAHEIAHQWWGALDAGGPSGFLSGMLANYSAMMVTEKAYGVEAMPRVTSLHMSEYFEDRAERSGEVPLVDVKGQPSFRRGLLAMCLMREYLGEGTVNAALRRLLEKHRTGAHATVRDVVGELRAVTPDSLQYLLTDLFETVTLWEFGTERAVVEATATGEYRVTLDVTGRKLRSDTARKTTDVPMDDLVDIGVFAASGGALGKPLYLARHRIRSGRQTITVTVREKPARAGVDPYNKLIERIRGDNVKAALGTR